MVSEIEGFFTVMLGILLFIAGLSMFFWDLIMGLLIFAAYDLLVMISGIWSIILGGRIALKQKPPMVKPQFCSKCGSPTRWIVEFQRYWCDSCKQYT